jgi:hypothetical protein
LINWVVWILKNLNYKNDKCFLLKMQNKLSFKGLD